MKNRLLNLRNILFILGAGSQLTFYCLLFVQNLANPAHLKQVDYLSFYTGGFIARYIGLDRLYDLELQEAVEADLTDGGELSRFYPHNHPPLLARILQITTDLNYTASYTRWILCLGCFHLAALAILILLGRGMGWQNQDLWILGISGLLFYPAISAYLKGQDSAFLLLAVVLWVHGLLTGHDRTAGLGLAMAAIRPHLMIGLAIPFLFKRRKVWWWWLAFGSVLLGYCTMLVGIEGMQDLVNILIYSGQGGGIDIEYMITAAGAATRTFPGLDETLLLATGYGGYLLAIAFLCLVWKKSQHIELKHISLAIVICMLFAPHLHQHDLVLLLIPAMGAAEVIRKQPQSINKYAALVPMLVSLLLLANQLVQGFLIPYLIFFSLLLIQWYPERCLHPLRRSPKGAQ